ncbi:Na+/H+ antiporter NhaA [Aestuariispira ectoiniformans]|uniref:Na+/H+ antiporter NhaA n=1 Tax=Aestuariispira ectoiniformans TaxID=2775080 RepID=UPI0035CD0385
MKKKPQLPKLKAIQQFMEMEASGGIVLVVASALALFAANSAFSGNYQAFLDAKFTISLNDVGLSKPLILWINDGLMAIFFFLVGLEIKREVMEGALSSVKQASLPGIAALGGIIVPALVYSYVNWGDDVAMQGWAIPAATDIAFALGVMALLGRRVPVALKVFLLALAIFDDLAAIIIIAIFYTSQLSGVALGLAAASIVLLFLMNHFGVMRRIAYVIVGVVLWVCVLKSGVHATLAGVVLAFAIPLKSNDPELKSPLKVMEHALHPWVAFLVLPVFAFANAGVPLQGLSMDAFTNPVALGIAAGLFLGKQAGVLLFVTLAVFLKLADFPKDATWPQIYGVSVLTGIGFTMSLFIGGLALDPAVYGVDLRLGVLGGSIISAILGYLILRVAKKKPVTES